MTIELICVFALRAGQALMISMPTMVCGMLSAGVLSAVVGPERVRRWLDRDGPASLGRAWLMAMVLPVCAFGVIPVLMVLWRMRVRVESLIVIGIVAPLTTPWTLGYMLDRAGLIATSTVLGASLLLSLLTAAAVGRAKANAEPREDVETPVHRGSLLMNWIVASGQSLGASGAVALLVGAAGGGMVAAMIPPNGIGEWLVERNWQHATLIPVLAWFTYVAPQTTALHAGEVWNSSTMPGLIVPLVVVGSSVHAGLLLLGWRAMGVRVIVGGVVLVLSAGALGLLIDLVAHDPGYLPEDTHAFEDLGRPFHMLDHRDGAWAGFVHRFTRPLTLASATAGVGVALLVLVGRIRTPASNTESSQRPLYLMRRTSTRAGATLGALWMACVIIGYFPQRHVLIGELEQSAAELIQVRQRDPARADQLASLMRKRLAQFPVSAALSGSWPTHGRREAVAEVRSSLDGLMSVDPTNRLSTTDVRLVRAIAQLARQG